MEIHGYKRKKKTDIKKWLTGNNSKFYIVILGILLLVLLFALKTVIGMHKENQSLEQNTINESESSDEDTKEDESSYVAKNQSYYIRINVSKNVAVIYEYTDNDNNKKALKAFNISVNPSVKTGTTFIGEKNEWKKITESDYGHYNCRLDNGEYICSTPYYYKQVGNLNVTAYNNLSNPSKSGSIYMAPADAKWIYNNCGINTVVEISSDFELPTDIQIPVFVKYDYKTKLEE